MTTYTWNYGSSAAGLQFNIEYDSSAQEFTVTSLRGSFDLNALWFSNDDQTANPYTVPKADKDLNMNGPATVWDNGTSSTQTIVWDGFGKLSSAGLGNQGENKASFISSGETATFTLADFHLSTFDPATYDTLGVRATSVNGHGDIKWADVAPEVHQDNGCVTELTHITNTPGDETLNDISGDGCTFVWAAPGPTSFDLLWKDLDTGVIKNVDIGPGDQTNPHISGDGQHV